MREISFGGFSKVRKILFHLLSYYRYGRGYPSDHTHSPIDSAKTTSLPDASHSALELSHYDLADLISGPSEGNGQYGEHLGLVIQYKPQKGDDTTLPPINKNPVNPKGRTILATIEALRGAGYDTSAIHLLPQPCDPTGQELPVATEDHLRHNQDMEYLAFALYLTEGTDIIDFALSRETIVFGIESPGFAYRVRCRKSESYKETLPQFLEIIAKNAFPYKGRVEFSPISPKSLPSKQG